MYIRNYEHQNFLDISISNAISTILFSDYADMMNRFVDIVLVRDHYKPIVIEAFSDHRAKYGVDDTKK